MVQNIIYSESIRIQTLVKVTCSFANETNKNIVNTKRMLRTESSICSSWALSSGLFTSLNPSVATASQGQLKRAKVGCFLREGGTQSHDISCQSKLQLITVISELMQADVGGQRFFLSVLLHPLMRQTKSREKDFRIFQNWAIIKK